MINFNFDSKKKPDLTFEDVEENAFFVDKDGFFCQKRVYGGWDNGYNIISKSDGTPYARQISIDPDTEIKRIIGLPTKIEF